MPSRINATSEVTELPGINIITPEVLEARQDKGDKRQRNSSTDSVSVYLKEIGRVPMLSREEELIEARKVQRYMQLLERQGDQALSIEDERIIQEGQRAKAHMVQANLRLVVSVAKKFQNRGLELMDMIQEGNLGLERGVEKFDPTKGYRFSTYAHWWIRQGITKAIALQSRPIRLPHNIMDKLTALKTVQRQFLQKQGRPASVEELATAVDSSPESIQKLLRWTMSPVSLDMKVGQEQETELGELIESEGKTPEEQAIRAVIPATITKLLENLEGRERRIIEMRFGLSGIEAQKLTEIGKALNISSQRVRKIEVKALQKLRQLGVKEQVQELLEYLE